MASRRGVTCPECGASTLLPDDLTVPSFACAFCHAVLSTAAFAGESAVSADALVGHAQSVMADPTSWKERMAEAPRFRGSSAQSRPSTCLHCRADVDVPLALEVHFLTCPSCGKEQPVAQHISDRERLELDMARQVAGNDAYERLLAEGLDCRKCGAHNPVPDDGRVQLTCAHCRAVILLSDDVDETAVARRRLRAGMLEVREEAMRAQEQRQRTTQIVVVTLIVLALAAAVVANLLSR
ncbi:MAG: hypothetical protein R3B82_28035 [Sandaracinaceae bacterium]